MDVIGKQGLEKNKKYIEDWKEKEEIRRGLEKHKKYYKMVFGTQEP